MKTKTLVQILTGVRPSFWRSITEELILKKKIRTIRNYGTYFSCGFHIIHGLVVT